MSLLPQTIYRVNGILTNIPTGTFMQFVSKIYNRKAKDLEEPRHSKEEGMGLVPANIKIHFKL